MHVLAAVTGIVAAVTAVHLEVTEVVQAEVIATVIPATEAVHIDIVVHQGLWT